GAKSREVVNALSFWVAQQLLVRDHPPAAFSVLETHAAFIRANLARKVQFVCDKTFSIEAIDEGLMIAFRVHAKLARSGFHNGADNPATQSVRLGVSCESTPRHFDRAAGRADPEVAVAVFS